MSSPGAPPRGAAGLRVAALSAALDGPSPQVIQVTVRQPSDGRGTGKSSSRAVWLCRPTIADPTERRTAVTQAPPVTAEQTGEMTHREVLEALSGLLLAMFVAMLSSTIVSNALPTIVDDLHGSQTGYTWVVVATMLAMTATTPIWGKFADLFDKKVLVQTALVIFSVGSLIAGFAPVDGGADRRPRRPGPRRRRPHRAGPGRHRLDGLPARARSLQRLHRRRLRPRDRQRSARRWRPGRHRRLALVLLRRSARSRPLAFVVLQKTLRLPVVKRDDVSIDYLGAFLLVGGVSILLVWVSLGGQQLRLDLLDQRACSSSAAVVVVARPSTSRPTSPRTRSSRCACSRTAPSPSPPSPRC